MEFVCWGLSSRTKQISVFAHRRGGRRAERHSQVQVKTRPQASPATRVAWLLPETRWLSATATSQNLNGMSWFSCFWKDKADLSPPLCERRLPYLDTAKAVTPGLFLYRRCDALCLRFSSLHNTRCLSHPSCRLGSLTADTFGEFTNPQQLLTRTAGVLSAL